MAILPRPDPPWSSATVRPNTPISANCWTTVDRDQLVALVPALRVRRDLRVGVAQELVADRGDRLVGDADIAESPAASAAATISPPGGGQRGGSPSVGEHRIAQESPQRLAGDAEVARPDHLGLADRDAARPAARGTRRSQAAGSRLDVVSASRIAQPPRPDQRLPQCLDIGRLPGKAMRRQLVGVHLRGIDPAVAQHRQTPPPDAMCASNCSASASPRSHNRIRLSSVRHRVVRHHLVLSEHDPAQPAAACRAGRPSCAIT